MTKYDGPSIGYNRVIGATVDNLVLEINGKHQPLAWTSVEGIYATIAKDDDAILIMAFEVMDGRTPRTIIAAQADTAWAELKAVLHIALPGVVPMDVWEQALADLPMVLPVFRRRSAHRPNPPVAS